MTGPLRIRAEREERTVAGRVLLSVLRLEVVLSLSRLHWGFVLASPVGVRDQSDAGSGFKPVVDPGLALRALTLFGLAATIGGRLRGRGDERKEELQ